MDFKPVDPMQEPRSDGASFWDWRNHMEKLWAGNGGQGSFFSGDYTWSLNRKTGEVFMYEGGAGLLQPDVCPLLQVNADTRKVAVDKINLWILDLVDQREKEIRGLKTAMELVSLNQENSKPPLVHGETWEEEGTIHTVIYRQPRRLVEVTRYQ